MAQSQLAVGISGLGTVADLALLSVPAILRPAPRPFDEQAVTAGVLADHALATIVTEPVTDWAATVRRTIDRPDRWPLWQAAGAPQRAAVLITGLLGGR